MGSEYVMFTDEDYFIRDSRVTLASIVHPFQDGASAETIQDEFPALRLDQVYGALAYYLANQKAVDAYLKAKDQRFRTLASEQPHLSRELSERLRRAKAPF
jgi:uncharacterized protein (DUF433 family)